MHTLDSQRLEDKVRQRSALYLSPEVARVAGMTLAQLQQFAAGAFHPSHEQVQRLARRMQIPFTWVES
jgi:hypothetical protein